MGRLVEPGPAVVLTADEAVGDDNATRVAKYIPGEILAGYVAMGAIISSMTPGSTTMITSWAVLGLGLVLTPVYLAGISEKSKPKALHLVLSTIAFAVWSYALGGPFALSGIHNPQIGSILLIAFTLVSGVFRPKSVG